MKIKEVFCERCGGFQPLIEDEITKDDLNKHPWGDLCCGTCKFVLLTVRIVEK